MGAKDADKVAMVAMSQSAHAQFNASSQIISVMQRDGKHFVVASADTPARSIVLLPCVPRACKVWDDAEHLSAARLKVQVMSGAAKVSKDASTIVREHEFMVVPEFKVPQQKTAGDAAVAGEVEWVWGKSQPETMHPYWELRRLRNQIMESEKQAALLVEQKNRKRRPCNQTSIANWRPTLIRV